MSRKQKLKTFEDFSKELTEDPEFHKWVNDGKWFCYDKEADSRALEIVLIRELFKRYIRLYKDFDNEATRIGGSHKRW